MDFIIFRFKNSLTKCIVSLSVPLVIVRSEPLIVVFSVFLQLIISTIVVSKNHEKVSKISEEFKKIQVSTFCTKTISKICAESRES